ncbi:hypothetical protein DGG96_01080 [Legionella qingyii]|uniref:Coiled-coil protein n=1 Tax=Legionella qingyii TaxID=2184757 RepID=A0A317U9U1_9GAMM|nr:hypothetical protein [Legionella qingyii]PWY57037.1 hypothetical protein DGG96_03345 [Legionella qingyii]PWY57342.1 hypothetical protein DGG96_01080 [Legionella qingyii]RUR26431.1 hypothetical protein ELY20_00485 [Legionella qingyii]RUR27451.1 hypothetical protein ELY16_04830 [Legionella qingyii]
MGKSKIGLIKHAFFNNSLKKNNLSFKEDEFHLDRLNDEFLSFHQVFISNKSCWTQESVTVHYLYFLCDSLISYYQLDFVDSDLKKLKQFRKKLEAFYKIDLAQEKRKSIDNFSEFMIEGLQTSILDHLTSFISISKLRQNVGALNTWRSQFTHSRSLANYVIIYLQKSSVSELIQEVNTVLGNQYSFIDGINFLNNSRKAITDLGIFLYTFRFVINLILVLKHILQSAISEELSSKKVLKQEMEKRGFIMASDLVWAGVGLLTTYNNFFHIAGSAVPLIIVASLTFDTLLLLAQWLFEAGQYQDHVQELQTQLNDATTFEQAVIQRQIDVLNDEWEAQCTYFAINIVGANLIATCFAISMVCTGPLALAGIALFSMLGNALYNTAEEYKKYQKSSIAVRRELANGKILDDDHHRQLLKNLNDECSKNYLEFWNNMAFNVGGIAFLITAAVASWPIALGVTLIYVGYRLNDTYQKQLNPKEEAVQDIYRLLELDSEQSEGVCLQFAYN